MWPRPPREKKTREQEGSRLALFVIGMLAALLVCLILLFAILYVFYRFFKWSLTFLWRALTSRVRVREAQLQAREEALRVQEKIFQSQAQQLKAYIDREYQEWWEKTLGLR